MAQTRRRRAGTITRSEAREAILRSGYLLETRVEALLRAHSYSASANSSYEDPETGKSREIDVHAITGQRAGRSRLDWLFAVLLVECVNNPEPLVLISKDEDAAFLHHQEIKFAGVPVKVRRGDSWEDLSDFLRAERWHHYCQGKIATQFCSFTRKKSGNQGEWMASHEGGAFDAFKKICDATAFHQRSTFRHWRPGHREDINLEAYYPVIVVQGELLEGVPSKRGIALKRSGHLQFRRSVTSDGSETNFQIDVVQERALPRYLELVRSEIATMTARLRRHHELVRASMEAIVERAKSFHDPDDFEAIFSFRRA